MLTNFTRNALLDHEFGGPAFTPPATYYAALFLTAPTLSSAGVECSGNGYSRAAVANNLTNFPASVAGVKTNGTLIQFPTATGAWGPVVAVVFFDAATAGTQHHFASLGLSKSFVAGQAPYFPAGSLTFTLDASKPLPGVVTSPSAVARGETEIVVSWTLAVSLLQSAVVVEHSADGSTGWVPVVMGGSPESYSDQGLNPGEHRYYRIKTRNGTGDSAYSSTVNATTGLPLPDEVTDVAAVANGGTEIDVTWTLPVSGVQTSVVLEHSPTGSGSWTVVTLAGNATSYNHTGLTGLTTRYYRIKTHNATGDSAYSANVNATTALPLPDVVTSPSAVANGSSEIDVSWTLPVSAWQASVILEYSADGSAWTPVTLGASAVNYAHTGLGSAELWYYRVKTRNATGDSSYCSTVSATTEAGMPAGARGIWLMDQYTSASVPRVPNSVSAVAQSQNKFFCPRRGFDNTQLHSDFWLGSGITVVDNAGTAPDGSNDASSLVAAGDFFLHQFVTLTAGVKTMTLKYKRLGSSDQQFKIGFYNAGIYSPTLTATSSWQTVVLNATVAAGLEMCLAAISFDRETGAELLIVDAALYDGAVDLGEPVLDGHMYIRGAVQDDGALNFDSTTGGPVKCGLIQFTPPITGNAFTVLAYGRKTTPGGYRFFESFLSKRQAYNDFLAKTDTTDFVIGGAETNHNYYMKEPSGYHFMGAVHTGTAAKTFRDKLKLIERPVTAPSISINDLFVARQNHIDTPYELTSEAFYDRALTDAEVRQAELYMEAHAIGLGKTPETINKIVICEGDSLTFGYLSVAYPERYVADSPIAQYVYNAAVSGSYIADVTARFSQFSGLKPAGPVGTKLIYSLLIGANDLRVLDEATYMSSLETLVDLVIAAGYVCLVGTLTPQTFGGYNPKRNVVNPLIRSMVASKGVNAALADYAADGTIGTDAAASNTSLYPDGLHFGDPCAEIQYGIAKAAIDAI